MTERRELPYGWAEVKAQLQREIDPLLRRLLPGFALPRGDEPAMPLNPRRGDRRPGSFIIHRRHQPLAVGAWKDFATGEGGDVFKLIEYIEGLATTMDVYWWALDFLRLPGGPGANTPRTKAQAQQDRERAQADRVAAQARDESMQDEKSAGLFKRWLAVAPGGDTLAQTYLTAARGIPLERLSRFPRVLRFEARADHFDEDGVVTEWPAMTAAMTRGAKVVGLHRTFLAPDGLGKAPVKPAKKMYGPIRGAAIRLTRGEGDLSPTDAAAKGRRIPLILGEGIETVLTCGCARPDYRAWAAGSLSLMGLLDWPDCASALILLRDNDWKPEAVTAFEKVELHFKAQAAGRPLKVLGSSVGNDFNDWGRS